ACRDDLASRAGRLGILYEETGRHKEAELVQRDALALRKTLADEQPIVPSYRADLAKSNFNLGNLYQDACRHVEAEQAYREALNIWKILADKQPAVTEFAVGLASTQAYLANVGQPEHALPWHTEAIASLEAVLAKQPEYNSARLFLCHAYWGRAQALMQ